jgi:hypothetical protein
MEWAGLDASFEEWIHKDVMEQDYKRMCRSGHIIQIQVRCWLERRAALLLYQYLY